MLPKLKYLICVICFAHQVYGHILKGGTGATDTGKNVIQCYCNSPSCITSSYMCKSEKTENGCFKKFDLETKQYSYGCLDSTIKKTLCIDSSDFSLDSKNLHECCYSDMCNQAASEKLLSVIYSSNTGISESEEDKIKEILSSSDSGKSSITNYYTNSEIWLRAVLIAVPICGLMVLLILVFIAVRMLKSDIAEDTFTSAKLLKRKYEMPTANNAASANNFVKSTTRSQIVPKCNLFEKRLSLVFKSSSQDKNSSRNATGYTNFYKGKNFIISDSSEYHHQQQVPRVHGKFSKQNLNILKLPYKFNELKQKNNLNNKNIHCVKNDTGSSGKNTCNNNNLVTIDSNVNNFYLIDNNCNM